MSLTAHFVSYGRCRFLAVWFACLLAGGGCSRSADADACQAQLTAYTQQAALEMDGRVRMHNQSILRRDSLMQLEVTLRHRLDSLVRSLAPDTKPTAFGTSTAQRLPGQ